MEITPLLTSFNSVIRQTGKSLPLVTLTQDNQLITQLAITGDKDVAPLSITAHFLTGRSLIQKAPDIFSHIKLVFELAIIPFSQPGDAAIQEALAASMYTMETKELGVFMYQFCRDSDRTLRDAHEREDLYRGLSTVGTKSRNRGEKPLVFFALRSKSDKNDFFREIFLLKLIFYVLEEYLLSALSRPVQQAIPTFGSYCAQSPSSPFQFIAFSCRVARLKAHDVLE